eukprot:403341642
MHKIKLDQTFLTCSKCAQNLYLLRNYTYSKVLPDNYSFCVEDCSRAHSSYINNPLTKECQWCGYGCQSCNIITGCEICPGELQQKGYSRVLANIYQPQYLNSQFQICTQCENDNNCQTCSSQDPSICLQCDSNVNSKFLATNDPSDFCYADGEICLNALGEYECLNCAYGYSIVEINSQKRCYQCDQFQLNHPEAVRCSFNVDQDTNEVTFQQTTGCLDSFVDQVSGLCTSNCGIGRYGSGQNQCLSCNSGYFLLKDDRSISYGSCLLKENKQNFTIYVKSVKEYQVDNPPSELSGSLDHPLYSIQNALFLAEEMGAPYLESHIDILLINTNLSPHFMLKQYPFQEYQPLKRDQYSQTTRINIMPDQLSQFVTINYKLRDTFKFKVGPGLSMKWIQFDAIDSLIDEKDDLPLFNCSSDFSQNCCYINQDNMIGYMIEGKSVCQKRYQSTDVCMIPFGGSFIEFDYNINTMITQYVYFNNFLHEFINLIQVNEFGGNITMSNVQFDNINSCGSIIGNKQPNAIQKVFGDLASLTAHFQESNLVDQTSSLAQYDYTNVNDLHLIIQHCKIICSYEDVSLDQLTIDLTQQETYQRASLFNFQNIKSKVDSDNNTIQNCNYGNQGAIYNFQNTLFTDSNSFYSRISARNGGIINAQHSVIILNNLQANNLVGQNGAGFYLGTNVTLTINNATISDVESEYGGFIYSIGHSEFIEYQTNIVFRGIIDVSNVYSKYYGGFISASNLNQNIDLSNVLVRATNFSSELFGAFIYYDSNLDLTVENIEMNGILCWQSGCFLKVNNVQIVTIKNLNVKCYDPNINNVFSITSNDQSVSQFNQKGDESVQYLGSPFQFYNLKEVLSINNTISSCKYNFNGGVFDLKQTTFTDYNSTFIDNDAQQGGVVNSQYSNLVFKDTKFFNSQSQNGGGICQQSQNNTIVFTNVQIQDSVSFFNGGFLYLFNENMLDENPTSYTIFNGTNVISNTKANLMGGFIYCNHQDMIIEFTNSTTVSDSEAINGNGGFIYLSQAQSLLLENMIVGKVFASMTRSGSFLYSIAAGISIKIMNSSFTQNEEYFEPRTMFDSEIYSIKLPDDIKTAKEMQINGNLFTITIADDVQSYNNTFIGQYVGLDSSVFFLTNINYFNESSSHYENIAAIGSSALNCMNCRNINIHDNYYVNISSYQKGGAIGIFDPQEGSISITQTTFQNSQSIFDGGAIYFSYQFYYFEPCTLGLNFILQYITAINCQSQGGAGGFIFFWENRFQFNLFDSTFENTYASSMGSAIHIYSAQDVNIRNITATGNNAQYQGSFFFYQLQSLMCQGGNISIKNSIFDCKGKNIDSALYYIDNAQKIESENQQVVNCGGPVDAIVFNVRTAKDFYDSNSIYENVYGQSYGVYDLNYLDNIHLTNNTYTNIQCQRGCIANIAYLNNEVLIDSIVVQGISMYYTGGLISYIYTTYGDSSRQMVVKNSKFSNVYQSSDGGFIYIDTQSPLDISFKNNSFTNFHARYGGIIYSYQQQGTILFEQDGLYGFNNVIKNIEVDEKGTVIYSQAQFATILINNVHVQCNQNEYSNSAQQGVFYIKYSNQGLSIWNSLFENCTNYLQGAIVSVIESRFQDSNSTYRNNYAVTGGVFFFQNAVLNLYNSKIYYNRAQQSGAFQLDNYITGYLVNCQISYNSVTNQGGAISAVRTSLTQAIQNLTITGGETVIEHNTANYGGFLFSSSEDLILQIIGINISYSKAYLQGGFIDIQKAWFINIWNSKILYMQSQHGSFINSESERVEYNIDSTVVQCFNNEEQYDQAIKNRDSSMYIFKAKLVYSIKNQFRNCQNSNDGGLITIRQSIFSDQQSLFIGNKGYSGGVIQSQGSQITINGSTFTNNSAENGGVFLATESSIININQSKFQYNKASFQGGVLTAQTNSLVIVLNSRFLENESEGDTSVLDILSSSRTEQVKIINCTFQENVALKNTISFMYSQALIQNSKFIDNQAKQRTKNIFMGFTNLTISNCLFDQPLKKAELSNSKIIGTYIFVIFDVNLIIQSSTFKNGLSSQGGAVYIYGDSSVQIGASYFTNNYANLEGGAIYSSGFNLLSIVNNTKFYNNFANNDGDDIYVTNTENIFQLYDTSLQNQIGKNSISVQQAAVEIINVTIRDVQYLSKLNYGGALKCSNCYSLLIKNTILKNLSSQIGGAIYLQEDEYNKINLSGKQQRYLIQNSSFTQIQAVVGGSIYIDNVQSLRITKSNFTKSTVTNKYSLETSQAVGSGGVIYHTCDSTSQNCKLDISQENIFKDNFAAIQGGVLYWDTVEPIISLTQSTYVNNFAGFYGNNIACFAQELIKISQDQYTQQTNFFNNQQQRLLNQIGENLNENYQRLDGNGLRLLTSKLQIVNQRSGGSIPTTYLALVDKYGQILGSNSNSKIQVFVNATYNSNPKANVYPPVIEGQNQFSSTFGVFVIEDLIFDASPGYQYSIVIQSDAIDVTKQANKDYMKKLNSSTLNLDLIITLRECQIGEQFTVAGKCEECQNSFSLNLQLSPGSCIPCPSDKAICPGGSSIYPLPGYWRKSNTSTSIIPCLYQQACLGTQNKQQSLQGECALGYQGILCADCQTEFSRSGEFKCSQCPNRVVNIVRLTFIVAGVSILLIFLIRQTLNSASDKNNITNIYFKILINHFQLIMMTATFDINWTDEIKGFFSETKQVATVSSQVFSIDCFLDNRYEDPNKQSGDDQSIRIFFVKLIMIAILPFLLLIGCFTIWSVIKLVKNNINLKNSVTSSVVIALFLAHSSIVQYMFYDFKCKKIDDQERVLNDLEVVCWDVQHTIYSYFVALPSILVWGLGTPLFSFSLLLKNKDKLDTIVIREQYGFIYRGYKQKFYFWEIIIIYRKILIIFIAIFIKTAGVIAQTLFVLIVLIIRRALNNLEGLSLVASMFTLYFGLFFLVDKPQSWVDSNPDYAYSAVVLNIYVKKLFFSLILLFNIGFFIYWCFTVSFEIHDRLILKYTKIYLYFCLCNNKAKLAKDIQEHKQMQDNENYQEQFLILTQNLHHLFKEGKLALNQKSVERLGIYLAEDKILQVVGKTKQEYNQKKKSRSRRIYQNQNRNTLLSQLTQQDNKSNYNDQIYENDSDISSQNYNNFIKGQVQFDKILQLIEDETNYSLPLKSQFNSFDRSSQQNLKK